MDFAFDQQTEDLRGRLLDFMDSHVYPAEPAFAEIAQDGAAGEGWDPPAVLEDLKAEARRGAGSGTCSIPRLPRVAGCPY